LIKLLFSVFTATTFMKLCYFILKPCFSWSSESSFRWQACTFRAAQDWYSPDQHSTILHCGTKSSKI